MPQVVVDLEADYLALLREELASLGVTVPPSETTIDKVSYIYWNAKKRLIPTRQRNVHLAREFRMPFDKSDQDGVARLLRMFEEGANVNPHLSRHAKKPKPFPTKGKKAKRDQFHDGLLNDWDIQHFHWDDGTDTNAPRSSMLLFVMVKPDDVYVIDVLPHGHWSRQDLLERVHLNWPHLLKEYEQPREEKVRGFPPLTDEQMATLRSKGYSTIFTASDGTEYLPPGGGQVVAHVGLDVVMWTNRAVGVVSHWNNWLKENPDCVADTIQRAGKAVPEVVTLKLELDDNNDIHVLEEALRVRMRLGPLFPPPGG